MPETIHTIVFQEKKGGGNPCPVTLNADALTTEEMQAMAKEFGQESAFLTKPERADCDYKVRYFVPMHEMEMCIHATIGSATVLIERGLCTKSPIFYETCLGPVKIEWGKKGDTIAVGVNQFLPNFHTVVPTAEEICRALRITPEQLASGPVESVSTSRFKLIVPLKNKTTLYNLKPDYEYLWNLCDKYETTGFYPFACVKENAGKVFYARQFPKRAGYPEDPATGVAASALGAYLCMHHVVPVQDGWNSYTIKQGEAMGKPSIIYSECFLEQGKIIKTRVKGNAFIVP